jgi:hypothetical protein
MWGFRRRSAKRSLHDTIAAQSYGRGYGDLSEHERDVIDVRANIAAKTPQIAQPWESVAQQVAELSPRAISELVALPADRNEMALDNAQLDDWAREGSPAWAEVFAELRRIGRRLDDAGGYELMVLVHDRVVSLDVLGACVSPSRYLEAFWDGIGSWRY